MNWDYPVLRPLVWPQIWFRNSNISIWNPISVHWLKIFGMGLTLGRGSLSLAFISFLSSRGVLQSLGTGQYGRKNFFCSGASGLLPDLC